MQGIGRNDEEVCDTSKGPYLNDVYTERGGGGCPNADVVREVAWI